MVSLAQYLVESKMFPEMIKIRARFDSLITRIPSALSLEPGPTLNSDWKQNIQNEVTKKKKWQINRSNCDTLRLSEDGIGAAAGVLPERLQGRVGAGEVQGAQDDARPHQEGRSNAGTAFASCLI